MPKCEHRNRLLGEWQESVAKFSDAVKRLRQCNGDGSKFAEQYRSTEQARLHAENTCMMVEHTAPNTGAKAYAAAHTAHPARVNKARRAES
jgi:hypothetical protein